VIIGGMSIYFKSSRNCMYLNVKLVSACILYLTTKIVHTRFENKISLECI
jgi:hypothetical protein